MSPVNHAEAAAAATLDTAREHTRYLTIHPHHDEQ
jgi:hypothetical protein